VLGDMITSEAWYKRKLPGVLMCVDGGRTYTNENVVALVRFR